VKKLKELIIAAVGKLRSLAKVLSRDGVTVYAAQASFFAIISAMPFLSLLISVASLFIPPDAMSILDGLSLSEEVLDVLGSIVLELQVVPKIPLLSVSVVVALWSASRGISAVQLGLERIYRAGAERGFFIRRLLSLAGTLAFIAMVVIFVVLLMFGDYIGELFHLGKVTDIILSFHIPFILVLLTLALTLVYAAAARRSKSFAATLSAHVPGAVFAAAGWVIFSKGYSLYLRFFPRASYVYGSIGAICLLMLWFYFCMIILFLGAEVNKWRLERGLGK